MRLKMGKSPKFTCSDNLSFGTKTIHTSSNYHRPIRLYISMVCREYHYRCTDKQNGLRSRTGGLCNFIGAVRFYHGNTGFCTIDARRPLPPFQSIPYLRLISRTLQPIPFAGYYYKMGIALGSFWHRILSSGHLPRRNENCRRLLRKRPWKSLRFSRRGIGPGNGTSFFD